MIKANTQLYLLTAVLAGIAVLVLFVFVVMCSANI